MPYPGGKASIVSWIISYFPSNYTKLHYVEPFGGSLNVFLNKRPSVIESINDLDSKIYNLYKNIRDNYDNLIHKIDNTLYNENDFNEALEVYKNDKSTSLDKAWATYIIFNLSIGGSGKGFGYAVGLKKDNGVFTRQPNKFYRTKSFLSFIKERLSYAQIFNKKADWFIKKFKDIKEVFMYIDPPYPDTRQEYENKFTMKDFNKMLDNLYNSKFKWILSFYEKENMNLSKFKNNNFRFIYKDILNKQSTGKDKRTECLLLNYHPKTEQGSLL